MTANPWDKFYWNDWENDPALRLCSLAAQGLWMRCLCIAAKADPKGYVTVAGRPLTPADLAVLVGASEREVETLLSELAANGVFSRDRKGRIYSRRMLRDVKKSQEGRKHKLAALSQVSEKPPKNPGPSRGASRGASTHIPEARYSEPNGSAPPDMKALVFGPGLDWLSSQSGRRKESLRSLAGRWCRDYGEAAVIEVLGAAQRQGPLDPVPWIERALRERSKPKSTGVCPL